MPRLANDVVHEWGLTLHGAPMHGHCSLVLPVVRPAGAGAAMLKIGYDGDDEGAHEAQALTRWNRHGAVGLLRADPRRRALLLEALSTRDLTEPPIEEAAAAVAALYPLLHQSSGPPFASMNDVVGGWLDGLERLGNDIPLPRSLRDQALSLGRELLKWPAEDSVLLHGDLHWENVLAVPDSVAGSRTAAGLKDSPQWLAIDPKPFVGDPHLEPVPLIYNRADELRGHWGGLRWAVRERLETIVDACAEFEPLDRDRVRDWFIVRTVINCGWIIQDVVAAGRGLTDEERASITWNVTLAKAVMD